MRHTYILVALLACGNGSTLPTQTITVDGQSVTAEIAATPADRAQGLMFRDELGADAGMLFVYPDEKPRKFWMKDTRIPLSIAFASSDGTIVKISEMAPFDTSGFPSLYPARYALEMNKGWFASHGVEKGDKLTDLPTVEAK